MTADDRDCCATPARDRSSPGHCPVTGVAGARVRRETVKALLTETALARLTMAEHRFCPDPSCAVVYFTADGDLYRTTDVRVPVWQKEPSGARMICYCFGENEAVMRREVEADGVSGAAARVRAHIAAKRCACEVRNPRGVCCLGDVIAIMARVTRER